MSILSFKEPLINSWNVVLRAEIAHRGVANLPNSPAIGCDSRLALNNFITQSHRSRINQRFLKYDEIDNRLTR